MDTVDCKLLLADVRIILNQAIKASQQSAYNRRLPASESLALFKKSHQILEQMISRDPRNAEALLLMSQCFECMMRFAESAHALQEAINAGEPKTKKLLKKLALLEEAERWWQTFPLTPSALDNLGDFLESNGIDSWSTSTEFTEQWLKANGHDDCEKILAELAQRGGATDFLILSNIVQG